MGHGLSGVRLYRKSSYHSIPECVGGMGRAQLVILVRARRPFDPYLYTLLNLFLSMLASLQAPIILMSQNRQAAKDRLDAARDYEVNLKAELEIMTLHEKLDTLREGQWEQLMEFEEQQLALLAQITERLQSGQGCQ
jgi:uncharacterized membrane protein